MRFGSLLVGTIFLLRGDPIKLLRQNSFCPSLERVNVLSFEDRKSFFQSHCWQIGLKGQLEDDPRTPVAPPLPHPTSISPPSYIPRRHTNLLYLRPMITLKKRCTTEIDENWHREDSN